MLYLVSSFFRNAFYRLNYGGISHTSYVHPSLNTTDFNTSTYTAFRGYSGPLGRPKGNSFYFYFGIIPGAGAIEIMNRKYFTDCEREAETDFVITSIATDATIVGGSDGTITLEMLGGTGPFTYTSTSNGTSIPNGTITDNGSGQFIVTFNGLSAGTYTFSVQDSGGYTEEVTVFVGGPQVLNCSVAPINSQTISGAGSLIIEGIGGTPSGGIYTYTISLNSTVIATGPFAATTTIQVPYDNASPYIVTVSDGTDTCTDSTLVLGPQPLLVTHSHTNEACDNTNDGTLSVSPSAGTPPYTVTVSASTTGYYSNNLNHQNLEPDTYSINVIDSAGDTYTGSEVVLAGSNPNLVSLAGSYCCYIDSDTLGQPASTNFRVNINSGTAPYTIKVNRNGTFYTTLTNSATAGWNTYNNAGWIAATYELYVIDVNGCTSNAITVSNVPGVAGSICPDNRLTAPATQTITTSGGTQQGQIQANATGGSGGYSYTWYYNGSATSYNTATLNLSSANFGNQWKCLVRDSNQCGVFTNELTIT